MNEAKIIEGLKALREGVDLFIESLSEVTHESRVEVTNVAESVVEPEEEKKTETPVVGTVTREQLENMTYNNLKKFAKDLGISATGNREEITSRILGEEISEESKEEPKEEVSVASNRGKVVPINSVSTSTEDDEEDDEEEDVDPLYQKVLETVEDMETEEIADVLAEIGVSAKGKRESLIEKVYNAVKDGLLNLDEDEEEDDEEESSNSSGNTVEKAIEDNDDEDEEDDVNDIENPDMTKERKSELLKADKSFRNKFEKGNLKRKEMIKFLQKFYDTEEDMDDMSDEDILDTFIDAKCRMIDDEGTPTDFENPYILNGVPACCGRFLEYSKDTGNYICEFCGSEYEAEEEE